MLCERLIRGVAVGDQDLSVARRFITRGGCNCGFPVSKHKVFYWVLTFLLDFLVGCFTVFVLCVFFLYGFLTGLFYGVFAGLSWVLKFRFLL